MGSRKKFWLRSMVVLALITNSVLAEVASSKPPRIGLVLSGGGARGAAHIGVLKVLQELRVPFDVIVGTSMGALVGGVYASGLSLQEMESRVTSVDWNELFVDDSPRKLWPARRKQESLRPTWEFTIGLRDGELELAKGAIAGQKVELFLADLARNGENTRDFDDLPIPFRAIATNLENGQMQVFDSGSLASAMRASMSVPGLFAPVEIDGTLYVDGGLVRNLGVDVARSLDVDVIIAINLGSTYLTREQLSTLFGVAGQMIAILTEQNVERSLAEIDRQRDVLIIPELGDISSGDFGRAAEAIAVGEKAARNAAAALSRYSLSETEYRKWRRETFSAEPPVPIIVNEVEVKGLNNVNDALFNSLKGELTNKPFDRVALDQDLSLLYGRGDFERLNYSIVTRDNRNLLIVNALEKSWGPGYLQFGLGVMSDYKGDVRTGVRATYRRTWVNSLGAEWLSEINIGNEPRFYTEFFQPFRLDRAGFIAPFIDLKGTPLSVFLDDNRVARYDVNRYRIGADLGTTLAIGPELRLGAYFGETQFKLDTGDPFVLHDGGLWDSGIRASLVNDTLNSPYIPTSGHRLMVSVMAPLEAFGAEEEYARIFGEWSGALSKGSNSLVTTIRGGTSIEDMPYYDQFPLGGFLKLSGYANEQFRGDDLLYGNLVYYRRVSSLPSLIGRGLYLGGSLESGKVWNTLGDGALNSEETRYGGSLFFAADSLLGPFFVALGLSAEGDTAVYVLLGQP